MIPERPPPSMHPLPSTDLLLLKLRLQRFWHRRRLGQHFLTDHAVLGRIARLCAPDPETLAVEIGAGPGLLTTRLAERSGAVLAIELDTRFKPFHEEVFGAQPRLEWIYRDALQLDLHDIARDHLQRRGWTRAILTGNLPFQVTSPLLFRQCDPNAPWSSITVMVQREVADRIASPCGSKAYGALTVKLACWWRLVDRFEVPSDRFFPRPKVQASLIRLERLPNDRQPDPRFWPTLSRFVDAAFGQRRKKLLNTLASLWPQMPHPATAQRVLMDMNISPLVRAEQLSPQTLTRLCRRLLDSPN